MKKAFIMSTKPQWTKMYGKDKVYEFRGNNFKGVTTGMTGYVYESLGRKLDGFYTNNPQQTHLGQGKVIATFEVGKVYDLNGVDRVSHVTFTAQKDFEVIYINKGSLKRLGYTNQPLAFEIKNYRLLDTPLDVSEFIYFKPKCSLIYNTASNEYFVKGELECLHDLNYGAKCNIFCDGNAIKKAPQSMVYVVKKEV